jgi:hypothetical protein
MKIKTGFVTYSTDGEQLMICVDGSFCGMVRSNGTAGRIIELLKVETTPNEVAAKMAELYDAPLEVIAEDVNEVISELRKIGAIDE